MIDVHLANVHSGAVVSPPRRWRGFATVTALTLLVFIGATLGSLSMLFSQQARRTSDDRRDAQLRQLLLAGAQTVVQRASAWPADAGGQNWAAALPKELGDAGASVAVKVAPGRASDGAGALSAVVEAKFDGHAARQTLTLGRSAGRWVVVAARLGAGDE
jgi:hypothetical protein